MTALNIEHSKTPDLEEDSKLDSMICEILPMLAGSLACTSVDITLQLSGEICCAQARMC